MRKLPVILLAYATASGFCEYLLLFAMNPEIGKAWPVLPSLLMVSFGVSSGVSYFLGLWLAFKPANKTKGDKQ